MPEKKTVTRQMICINLSNPAENMHLLEQRYMDHAQNQVTGQRTGSIVRNCPSKMYKPE